MKAYFVNLSGLSNEEKQEVYNWLSMSAFMIHTWFREQKSGEYGEQFKISPDGYVVRQDSSDTLDKMPYHCKYVDITQAISDEAACPWAFQVTSS